LEEFIIICGHYEGIDQRIIDELEGKTSMEKDFLNK